MCVPVCVCVCVCVCVYTHTHTHTGLLDPLHSMCVYTHAHTHTHTHTHTQGFWIRFTVHYNLCAGTVLGLGNEQQIKVLDDWQDQGLLGCFSLTEKLAGVNSGLVVNTQAHWDPNTETFNLHSPNLGAYKNWISQGLVADKTVAVADLFIKVQILQSRY